MYCISYMTWVEGRPVRGEVSIPGACATPRTGSLCDAAEGPAGKANSASFASHVSCTAVPKRSAPLLSRPPVAGEIQRRYPGLRPVGFWSPYEAAAWTIIGHRIRITQAAAIKARMAEQLGEPVSFGDRVVHAFPAPQRLAGLDTFPGLAGRKPEWLRSLAQAALDGQLDAARLRAMPHEEAMADLKKLPGIGDFSAGLTLLRGAGDPDAVPSQEPRLARAVALAYDLPGPATPEQILQISENWRPYRTWVTLLLRTQLEYETGEITGRQGHARTG